VIEKAERICRYSKRYGYIQFSESWI